MGGKEATMKKIILISMLLVGSPVFATVTSTQITTTLEDYCVPEPGAVAYSSVNVCGSVLEAKYSAGPKCSCYNSTYLTYSKSLRRCKPTCGKGYGVKQINDGKCPGGTRKVTISR